MLTIDQYHLNKLSYNPVNNNEFIYLGGVDGSIKLVGEEWLINLYIYLKDDFLLPANAFNIDIKSDFVTVSDITLNRIESFTVPDYILDKSTFDCYEINETIDTSESEFFNQTLTNYPINFLINFHIDESVVNNAQLSNSPEDIDELINESNLLNDSFVVNYTNFISSNQQGSSSINSEYIITNSVVYNLNQKNNLLFAEF